MSITTLRAKAHAPTRASMPRHVGHPYAPFCVGLDGTGCGLDARSAAGAFRALAAAMPDDAPEAERRRACLRDRAAQLDAGQHNPARHFRVMVPGRAPYGARRLRTVSYPCRGCHLYTFDEAWLVMETFASHRGWSDGHEMDTSAEGRGQNLTLGIIYDGIADPMRAVPDGESHA